LTALSTLFQAQVRENRMNLNSVPGYLINGPNHTPSRGSLANRLRTEVGPLTDPLAVTTKIRDIYIFEGLSDLWQVTKEWLISKGVPTP